MRMKSEDSKKAFLALFDKELPDSLQMDITDIVENLKRADSGCSQILDMRSIMCWRMAP